MNVSVPQRAARPIPLTATLAVGASAALLFAIEPFTGKVLLPRLGGTPSVWNSCVMVFQILLLAGYGYSVLLVRVADLRRAVVIHAALVGASVVLWPVAVRALWLTPDGRWSPVAWVVAVTVAGIGLPFAMLSATSPLLQVWLARASRAPLNVHRLYAVSNVASVAGLAIYVGALDPFVGVARQNTVLWIGYTLAMALALAVATRVRGSGFRVLGSRFRVQGSEEVRTENQEPSTLNPEPVWARGSWIALSFGASLCLYAVNTYMATDVASFPLLWCLPLGVFLGGFAAGFSSWAARARVWLTRVATLAAIAAVAHLVWIDDARTLWAGLLVPLLSLTFLVTAIATELAHRRPPDDRLAGYYAWVGLGGVLAGIASVVVLPWAWSSVSVASVPILANVVRALRTLSPVLLISSVPEYAASLLLAIWLLAPRKSERDLWRLAIAVSTAILIAIAANRYLPADASITQKSMVVGAAIAAAFAAGTRGTRVVAASLALAMVGGIVRTPESETLFESRNFFGTSRVQRAGAIYRLKHGTTLHGLQASGPEAIRPISYYGRFSPLGQVIDHVGPKNVLALGLGAGTVAAYGRPGDRYRFLEINPLAARIATDPRGWFSYVSDARRRGVQVDIEIGDGRLLAQAQENGAWDLVVVDAFSSDAIPVHLLSLEAIQMFNRKLSARGVLAFHVSNRFFDLYPVIAAAADRFGMPWAVLTTEGMTELEYQSTWVMLTGSEESAQAAGLREPGWEQRPIAAAPWTDDWANVLGTLRSWRFWGARN